MSEYNTETENLRAREVRMLSFRNIMREQFQLAYFGKISYGDSNTMSVLERHTMYSILAEQKKEEKKAQDEALKSSKEKSKNWKRR